jgi:hypothetical protein
LSAWPGFWQVKLVVGMRRRAALLAYGGPMQHGAYSRAEREGGDPAALAAPIKPYRHGRHLRLRKSAAAIMAP